MCLIRVWNREGCVAMEVHLTLRHANRDQAAQPLAIRGPRIVRVATRKVSLLNGTRLIATPLGVRERSPGREHELALLQATRRPASPMPFLGSLASR